MPWHHHPGPGGISHWQWNWRLDQMRRSYTSHQSRKASRFIYSIIYLLIYLSIHSPFLFLYSFMYWFTHPHMSCRDQPPCCMVSPHGWSGSRGALLGPFGSYHATDRWWDGRCRWDAQDAIQLLGEWRICGASHYGSMVIEWLVLVTTSH